MADKNAKNEFALCPKCAKAATEAADYDPGRDGDGELVIILTE